MAADETYPDEALAVVARYWADRLHDSHNYVRQTGMEQVEGADLVMVALAANRASKTTREQIEQFEQALIDELKRQPYLYSLGVDYWPDRTLSNACQAVGINPRMANFPMKTYMIFRDMSVSVGEGYRADWRQLWPVEENAQ